MLKRCLYLEVDNIMESLNEDGCVGQSTGVLPLLGAVPVVDESTGKVRMERVKVQRYVAGQRPAYAEDDSSDDEIKPSDDVKAVFEQPPPVTSEYLGRFEQI